MTLSPFTRSLMAVYPHHQHPSFLRAQWKAARMAERALFPLFSARLIPDASFTEVVDTLRRIYYRWQLAQDWLDAAITPLLAWLDRIGALEEHRSRLETALTRLDSDLDPLRTLIAWDNSLRQPIEAGTLPDDPYFRTSWEAYLFKYGVHGLEELDLAQPRFYEVPEDRLPALLLPPTPDPPPLSLRGWLTLPIWALAAGHLRLRDRLYRHMLVAFATVRDLLLRRADEAVARGQLASREALWCLTLDQVKQLDAEAAS